MFATSMVCLQYPRLCSVLVCLTMPYGTRKRPYLLCLTTSLREAQPSTFCPTTGERKV
jgi:hypothetical protein